MYENIIEKINSNVMDKFKNNKWAILLSIILLTIFIIIMVFYINIINENISNRRCRIYWL